MIRRLGYAGFHTFTLVDPSRPGGAPLVDALLRRAQGLPPTIRVRGAASFSELLRPQRLHGINRGRAPSGHECSEQRAGR